MWGVVTRRREPKSEEFGGGSASERKVREEGAKKGPSSSSSSEGPWVLEAQYHERIMKFDFQLQDGLNRMRMTQKPGMVVIYKSWCPVCTELKAALASSREIDYLSNYIVIVLLKDNDEPQDRAFSPDGTYIPRVFFLGPTGSIMYNVINSGGDPRYKYFYTTEKEIVLNIRRVLNFFSGRN